jgi:hypothetical protein
MGYYDCRCLVSGVSLKGADAVLVLLHQAGEAYRPIACAITGNYNRLGSIDGIEEDANTELILDFFLGKLQSGAFVVDTEYLGGHNCYPIQDVEQLLTGFERNINDYPRAAVLEGIPVVFALVCKAVWDGLARAPTPGTPATWFQELFKSVPVAEEMYGGRREAVSGHLRELAAVSRFLAGRGLVWRSADNPGQDYPEEMRQYLAEARQTFRDSAVMLDALKQYEGEVGGLLGDEE